MKYFVLLFVILLISSCKKRSIDIEPIQEESIEEVFSPQYSFFVAGHTYGHPVNYQYGLHPPFVNQISYINNYPNIRSGILTGDVVAQSTQAYWDSATVDINQFTIPIHIAAGNHDRGTIFENSYEYYYSFSIEQDLFIITSPTAWNIEGEQKDFLIETINEQASLSNNIFIFCHELIWWSPENEFSNVKINYPPHYPGSTNYWSEISPILEAIPNNVVVFAGDLGCIANVDSYMYHQYDNITLIANGMGGGIQDNIIITEVDSLGNLNFKLMGINNDNPFELAKLKEYELP